MRCAGIRLCFGLLCLLIVSFTSPLPGEEKADEAPSVADRLASPNEAPGPKGRLGSLPADYDIKAQREVHKNAVEIYANIDANWSGLIDSFSDERYSLTYSGGAGRADFSVGKLCKAIVLAHVHRAHQCFEGKLRHLPLSQLVEYEGSKGLDLNGAKGVEWIVANRELPLRTLQGMYANKVRNVIDRLSREECLKQINRMRRPGTKDLDLSEEEFERDKALALERLSEIEDLDNTESEFLTPRTLVVLNSVVGVNEKIEK